MSARGKTPAVVMAYTNLQEQAVAAVKESGHDLITVDVSGSDDAYWNLFDQLWKAKQTFVVVEHDIVVSPDAIDELLMCASPWCGFVMPYCGTWYSGLSCTKFEASILKAHPKALQKVATMSDVGHGQKHWCRLDGWLQGVLNGWGEEKHEHRGHIGHIRDGQVRYGLTDGVMPSHDCWR